ncbi:MAG: N-formylglutamate amidohydrolase, partial [Bacteroidota bacterium]
MKLDLNIDEIIARIENGDHFEAESSDRSIYLKIVDDVPFASFAIHNGHNLRPKLLEKCKLDDYERWFEEDPETLRFISPQPIVIASNDSRYEYDLNRSPENSLYETAWGKDIWKTPLTEEEKEKSLKKHTDFYRVTHALLSRLEKKFGSIIIFDVHSFNYRRIEKETPVFNIGTERIDNEKYGKYVNYFIRELSKITLPNIEVRVSENEVFFGRGYLLEYITKNFNALVLATEIKKIYCNELSGENYPLIIERLTHRLKRAIVNTAANFARSNTSLTVKRNNSLLSSELESSLIRVDKTFFDLAKDFEILKYTNPVNIEQAKKEFFKSKFRT